MWQGQFGACERIAVPSNEKRYRRLFGTRGPTTTPGNLQYGGHHVPKLRDGNSVVVRV